MRAAVLYEHGPLDNIVYEDNYPEPELLADWVCLKVAACSLNYHDIFTRRGMPSIKLPLPLITGSDVAGEVIEIGSAVSGVSIGDRVLVDPLLPSHGMIGERFDGGRAEYCVAHHSQLVEQIGRASCRERV